MSIYSTVQLLTGATPFPRPPWITSAKIYKPKFMGLKYKN